MHIIYADQQPPHLILSYLAIVGKGAERTVYKCYDLATRRFYAEKPIYPTEQKILMQLNRHGNILGFYNTFRNPLTGNEFIPASKLGIFIVEELAEDNLFTALQNHVFTRIDTRMYLIRDILENLTELHSLDSPFEKGLQCSHSDLKTENILIKKNSEKAGYQAWLTDYSLSGMGNGIGGTFTFQPPEYLEELKRNTGKDSPSSYILQFNKQHCCAKDIWAAGLIFLDIIRNHVTVDIDQSMPSLMSITNIFPIIENSDDESEIASALKNLRLDPEAILSELAAIKKSLSHSEPLSEAMDIVMTMLSYLPGQRPSAKSCLSRINKIIQGFKL